MIMIDEMFSNLIMVESCLCLWADSICCSFLYADICDMHAWFVHLTVRTWDLDPCRHYRSLLTSCLCKCLASLPRLISHFCPLLLSLLYFFTQPPPRLSGPPSSSFLLLACASLDPLRSSLSKASFGFNETDVPSLIKTWSTTVMKEWTSAHSRAGDEDFTEILFDMHSMNMWYETNQNTLHYITNPLRLFSPEADAPTCRHIAPS